MTFVFVTNKKGTSIFHVPVQTPAFPCSQRSQGAVICQKCRQHKKSAAQEVPETKITTLHRTRLLRYKRRSCYIQSSYQSGPKYLFRYRRHNGISYFAISDTFLLTQRILAGTKNSLRYIRHFIVSGFVIHGFDCT